jgi:hypothetical protein
MKGLLKQLSRPFFCRMVREKNSEPYDESSRGSKKFFCTMR